VRPPRLAFVLILLPLAAFLAAFQLNLRAAQAEPAKTTQAKSKAARNGKGKPATFKSAAKSAPGSASKGHSAKGALSRPAPKLASPGASHPGAAKPSTKAGKSAVNGAKGAKAHASKPGKKGAVKRSTTRMYRQQTPESDRIREIQQALNDHGYPLVASGSWDASTVEALKKFQTDQNIENLSGRGKLDSLTLIALGLGPRREPLPGTAAAPQRSAEGPIP
jgi:hypothetical protein